MKDSILIIFFIFIYTVIALAGNINKNINSAYKAGFPDVKSPLYLKYSGFSSSYMKDKLLKNNLKSGGIKQKLDSIIWKVYDESKGEWVDNYKDSYNYLFNYGYIVSFSYSKNTSNNKWENSSMTQTLYNEQGNIWKQAYYWTFSISDYYDILYEMYVSEYIYDTTNNQLKSIIFHSLADFLGFDSVKTECFFDSAGNMNEAYEWSWDSTTNLWTNIYKSEFKYDINKNLTEYFPFKINDTGDWYADRKEEYFYNGNNFRIRTIEYKWDTTINQWVNHSKDEYTFDLNFDPQQLLAPYSYFDETPLGKVLYSENFNWDTLGNNWVLKNKGEYFYSDSQSVYLNISADTIYMAAKDTVATFNISSNAIWMVYSDPLFSSLRVTPTTGSNDATIKIVAPENTEPYERIETITVVGILSDYFLFPVTIVQEGAEPDTNEIINNEIIQQSINCQYKQGTVLISNPGTAEMGISLYSIMGNLVYGEVTSNSTIYIDVRDKNPGIYILSVYYNNAILNQKIYIE
ncbi:MAG: T9SS type A sorting domain-containing protein [Bacteroidales bacterium]|nr:T9SS type A sorting domain-containing protein [Bacteroidales bacterium]